MKIKKIQKKIDIDIAKKIYCVFLRRNRLIQLKNERFIRNNKLSLLTTVFERDIFAQENCNIDAPFILGKYNLELSEDLKKTLNKEQYIAYKFGKLFSKKLIINFF